MVRKTLVCLFVLIVACTTMVFAADKPLVAHADYVVVGKAAPDTSHDPTLCSNVGPPTNEFGATGYFVGGPNSEIGNSQFMAMPCTPKANHTLTTVKGAWQWYGAGHNTIQICLYSDSGSNYPATQIGKCVTKNNLPIFLTTNTLVTANFTSQNLALTGGTQYWIVAQTPSKGPQADALDVWVSDGVWMGDNVGGTGWDSFQPNLAGVMAVSGK